MEDFHKKFLSDSIGKLRKILEISKERFADDKLKQELFRTLHTIKGTSQVLGLKKASQIAHRLENSVIGREINPDLLRKEIERLIEILEGKIFPQEPDFQETQQQTKVEILPKELTQKLSKQEKKILSCAISEGKNAFTAGKSFKVENFLNEFNAFQSKLKSHGEIIATLSQKNSEEFYFRFVTVTDKKAKEIEKDDLKIESFFDGKLILIINHLVSHGKKIASDKGKEVEFEFESSGNVSELSDDLLDFIFEILLHLIRNSVDHGIAKKGKIKIKVQQMSDKLILCLSDDGRGIDLSKIRRKAIEKGIIAEKTELSEQEILSLIFTPGFSMAEEVSEISGRGIGLDVVKQKVEERGGKIHVKTGIEGTSFEIVFCRLL